MKVLSSFVALLVFGIPCFAAGPFTDWSAPTNVTSVNTQYGESAPAISKNGLSLYFASNHPGSIDEADLWVAQRSSVDDPWGPEINLYQLNSASFDQAPALSRDEHYLFFATNRPGGSGGLDIWVSHRDDVHDALAWEPPVPITEINSSVNDAGPSYFENEGGRPQLYFQSQRAGGAGQADIYVSELQEDGTWSAPQRVVELNSSFQEQHPSIRFDGREIVFQSTRPPSQGFDLWASTRATVNDPWSVPVRLNNVNSPQTESGPYLSGDGMTLYFNSDRPGGAGSGDLWMSTRQRRHGNE